MADPLLIARHDTTECALLPSLANRHGLITGATGTTYTLRATGSGPANGAIYTITESNVRATLEMPDAWSGWLNDCTSSWIVKKGQAC